MKKLYYRFLLALLAICLFGCEEAVPETTMAAGPVITQEAETTPPATEVPAETQPQEERFLLTFVGDCTLGASPANYYADFGFIKTVGTDYGFPFRNVIGFFAEDECTFVNLEGPLTDEGYPVEKTHTFRGPEDFVSILTENSIDFVTLANNHAFDYGQTGYDNTLQTLKEAHVPFVERDASQIFTTPNGLTIGIYGAVYYKLDVADMTAQIRALREVCDLVIYAPHWGIEKTYHPTAEQTEVGRAAIDAGADIVWGSHPHALQPIEEYSDGILFYSLGNFSFGGNSVPEDFDTALIQIEIIRDSAGKVRRGETTIVPCCLSSIPERNNYQPTPYALDSPEYARVLSKLTGTWNSERKVQ